MLGVETSLPSFPEDEGKDSLLHIMSLLMYFLLFSLMLQMQHKGGTVIILSCLHVWCLSNLDCKKNKYLMHVSEIQLESVALRKSHLGFMKE